MGVIHFLDPIQDNYLPNILDELYTKRLYFPYLSGKKDLTIVDIGANIGLCSMEFAKYAKIVYAVEPASKIFECLEQNILDNHLENIKTFKTAVSINDGKGVIHFNKNTTMNSLKASVDDKTGVEEVKTITLKKFFEENKITHVDLLKLDIEGLEPEVLCSQPFLDIASMVDVLIFEYHTWSGRVPMQILNCLKDQGFFIKKGITDAEVFICQRIK